MIDPASIAFDIDGVVADTMSLFLKIAREDYGIRHIRYDDINRYMLEECLDLDTRIIGEILIRLMEGTDDHALDPIPGAVEVLSRIGGSHGSLHFVTARSSRPPIEFWLRRQIPDADLKIEAVGNFEAKADILTQAGVTHFVEDRLETCFQLHEVGITPIVFKQPWNREKHPFVEVDSWGALAEMIRFP